MIIRRYILKEFFSLMLAITSILVLALLSQQVVRYLNYVATGKVSAGALFALVGYEVPYLLVFLLPLSLFLSVISVINRLQVDYEMTILELSGFDQKALAKVVAMTATLCIAMVFVLMNWINPWASNHRAALIHSEEHADHLIQTLIPGRFHVSLDDKRVIYVASLSRDRKHAGNVFIAERKDSSDTKEGPSRWNIIVAEEGYQTEATPLNSAYFVVRNGHRYDGIPGQNDFKILKFYRYGVRIAENATKLTHHREEALPLTTLVQGLPNTNYLSELYWRASIPLLVVILSALALRFNQFVPRQGRYMRLIPAIILFFIYINLIILGKRWVEEGRVSVWIALLFAHGPFLLLPTIFQTVRNSWRK